jgi:cold-inducible RNA-binding protein
LSGISAIKPLRLTFNSAFATFGNVERENIVTDGDRGHARGFAFVERTEPQAAQTAISQWNGDELNGRAPNVNEARSEAGRRQLRREAE